MKTLLRILLPLTIICPPVHAQDTVSINAGWNLIGSVQAGAVPDILTTVPESLIVSAYFGYAPGFGYRSTDTLDNGVGYWVKAGADGIIVFKNAPPPDSCRSKAFIYEGRMYHTVRIGDQCWMAENLDVGTMIDISNAQTDNGTPEKYCMNNVAENCSLYGGLYQWDEAMQYVDTEGDQGICPGGWHIPSSADYELLSSTVSGSGNVLKAVSQGTGTGAGTNTTGFSALLTGYSNTSGGGGFYYLDSLTYIWSSTMNSGSLRDFMGLFSYTANLTIDYSSKFNGQSVRCVED
jgi:uncharacterized protein (TIGR02145 family)